MPTQYLPLARLPQCLPLHDTASSRRIEAHWQHRLPPHTLISRAGLAVFRLSAALAPHARQVWIACGPGHNGGDGLIAAAHWQRRLQACGGQLTVTGLAPQAPLTPDRRCAWEQAQAAGVTLAPSPPPSCDLAIDAVLGIGLNRPVQGPAQAWIERLQNADCPTLCVDLPSGLDADQGHWWGETPCLPSAQRHTLQLLTLKPGAFTHMGRTALGQCWFDDLGTHEAAPPEAPTAWLWGMNRAPGQGRAGQHHLHKGSHGDVWVLGGQYGPTGAGMAGAALLAARAALHTGAGRVYVALVGPADATPPLTVDNHQPELMFRRPAEALTAPGFGLAACVCGCGGGDAVGAWLPEVLARSPRLVLDADALNAIAADRGLQQALAQRAARGAHTVLTPHPLEAARLLQTGTEDVQAQRLASAQALADRWGCTVALKGSGTVVTAPDTAPSVNPTGNGWLATAGTGDVLAGMIGALLARGLDALSATRSAVYLHGQTAPHEASPAMAMTASAAIAALSGARISPAATGPLAAAQ
jgi:ADP-dependent NAD(P)H-hydrate dehydratase / NAD(P)H-hydrate epimerase